MTRRTLGRVAAVGGLVALAAAGGALWGERRATKRAVDAVASSSPAPAAAPRSKASPASGEEAVEVILSPEAIERAGIKTTVVRSQAAAGTITVPGTVTSNA